MKISQLRISTILLFFFFSFQVFSQDGSGSFKGIFSPDSIAGFDEVLEKNNALAIGLYGPEFNAYMFQKKRQFINEKYKFPFVDPEPAIAAHYRYSSSSINAAPCVNEGFELGNFTGWAISQGTNGSILSGTVSNSACNNNPCPTTIGVGAFASVVTTPYFDAFMNLSIPNSPFSGSKVAKLNNSTPSFAPVIRITQNFPVTVNNSLYDFAYYAVMQANSPHLCCEQPYMYVKMRDCFGNLLPTCPVFSITLPGTGCPGTGPTSWVITSTFARSNGWQRYSIDLAQYIGCSITMEITVGHCQYTGHYGYAYFDSGCNTMDFSVNSNTVSAPSPAPVTATVPCASTATINGPSGLGPYLWNGPPGSGVTTNTNQAIVVTAAGQYSVSMTPVGICNPINRIINLNFPPPTTINVSPTSSICTSGSVTTSTITASGPFIYSWTPGGSTSPSIVVSPSVTTIYTLEAKTGTCNGTFTRQISVNTTPTVNILPSNTALCPGQTGTLSAIGASTYVWFPGGLVGSTVSITQTATTTYTAIGTSSAGCTDTETVTIGMNGAPVVSAIVFGSTLVCAGSVVTLAGFGAASFTWMPGLLTSNPQTVTPYVTTTYTAIGASGTCTNLATVTVSADPGPSLTVAASPTLICPGYNSTLTAFGSAALGYTWAPGSTISPSIVVAPFVPTTYSVFSNNALSCISLYTLAPVINPVPIMTISPATPSVCYGSTFTLTAAGGSTYTWNPGSVTGSAIAVSPSTSTTYTIVGSNGTCTSSINSSLTVVPLPTVSASSSTASICSGQTLTLSATGAAQYTWMPGTMTASSVVISPTITTTYTVTGNTAACETTDTITIVVNNGPTLTAVASPTAICPGFTSTLSSSGAVSYTWNPSFINFSVVAASPTANTIYTVTGETIFGCLSSKTVGLIVNPVPTVNPASSTPSICVGSTASLTATGAVTYTWNPGSLTGSNVPVSPATTTNYTVVGSNSLGCTDQKTITLIVVPNPTVSPVANSASICTGFSSTLSATGATTYTWNPGALTGSSAIVSPTISTNYTLVGNSAGCTNSSTVLLTVNNGPTLTPVASPTAICPGFTSTLSSTGAVSYTWNPGALSASAIAVSPAVTTNYSVTGATAFGCLTTRTLGLVVSPIPTVNPVASSPSICIGGTSSLSATGALTYTWNPGNLTGSTVAVSPTTTTTYTVVGTNSVTCTDQRTVTITVVPLPTVSPVSTPPAICTGFSSTLTGTGATTYSWNPGALSGSSAVVAPTITTTYTLTGNTAGCSSSSTLALIVNYGPTLTPVASPTAICPGFTSTLSSTGAVSYTWNPGTLTGSAIVVSPPAGTSVYSVTGATA
ncbi:MAG: hypothetical protein PSX36_10910, partial [bacterium]|nr:hypothetical protein [bacterium]